MLSARSKALWLALVRSIAHRTLVIVLTPTPPDRSPRCLTCSAAVLDSSASHQESTAVRHWQEKNPRGSDRFRLRPRQRTVAGRSADSACLVRVYQWDISRALSRRKKKMGAPRFSMVRVALA